jgi:outer membrane lipoprotein SlyB
VKGKVAYAKSSGRLHAPGQVTIRLTSIQLKNGKTLSVSTSGFRAQGKSHTKSNVTKIGGGAAAGALIGALAGGGKGALIGTAVGAGAGTGVAAATGKEEAVIHTETAITFTTTANATAK